MNLRNLGPLGPVSALTLGGGGLGQVRGATTCDEAIATLREAESRSSSVVLALLGYCITKARSNSVKTQPLAATRRLINHRL